MRGRPVTCHHPVLSPVILCHLLRFALELLAPASQQSVKVKIKNSFIPVAVTKPRWLSSLTGSISAASACHGEKWPTFERTIILLIFWDPVDTFNHTMVQYFMINKTASSILPRDRYITTMRYPASSNPLLVRSRVLATTNPYYLLRLIRPNSRKYSGNYGIHLPILL